MNKADTMSKIMKTILKRREIPYMNLLNLYRVDINIMKFSMMIKTLEAMKFCKRENIKGSITLNQFGSN